MHRILEQWNTDDTDKTYLTLILICENPLNLCHPFLFLFLSIQSLIL